MRCAIARAGRCGMPTSLPHQVERLIVDLKRDKPHWGACKIRELLVRKLAGDVRMRQEHGPCVRLCRFPSIGFDGTAL